MIDNINMSSRKYKKENTIIEIKSKNENIKIGGEYPIIIAGPCSVESKEQIIHIAKKVKQYGANMLRGGAYKPRTSPYDFQGMKLDGLELLSLAKKETDLPIVSEVVGIRQLELFDDVDVLQVGARNMQNFELLKELGKTKKPILLKRGFSNKVKEWLLSAEYIMNSGNENVILCERGIRTFENATRNTLDLSILPLVKELSHLPIIVDPSHATGIANLVKPMSLAAIVSGADGLMIEVHNDPQNALSDGEQSILPEELKNIVANVKKIKNLKLD